MLLFGLGDGRREVELRPLERRSAVHNERHALPAGCAVGT